MLISPAPFLPSHENRGCCGEEIVKMLQRKVKYVQRTISLLVRSIFLFTFFFFLGGGGAFL